MTRKSSPSTDDGSAFSPPATTDDEGIKLRSGLTVPTPTPGTIATNLPTVMGAAHAAVEPALDDERFTPISRSAGFKTTPFHLAAATAKTASTTAHAAAGDYDSPESSDEERSQPLLSDQPETFATLNEDPVILLAAISDSEHQRNLAFIKTQRDIQKIGRCASNLMESTRIVAESLSNNTAEFTRRIDGMDKNLAAIKHLLEQSNASSSKLANEVQSLLTQAVSHHDKLHQQGQAAFHRVQEVENLVADFKSTSATIIDALDKSVPK
jgi:hypothetical protein